MDKRLGRRNFIAAWAGAIPGLGLLAYLIPVWFRYLFPTMEPFGFASEQELGTEKPQFVINASDMQKPWSMAEFEFVRQARLFTSEGIYNTRVPGFLVAIPNDPSNPKEGDVQFRAFSRICVHLGCVFDYVDSKDRIRAEFNYSSPVNEVHFGCPCHLSVYDLSQLIPIPGVTIAPEDTEWMLGPKVVSGPAPRPARPFKVGVEENGDIFILQLEGGGLS